MSDKKISQLTEGTTPQDSDEFVVSRGSDNVRLTWAELKAATAAADINWCSISLGQPTHHLTVAQDSYTWPLSNMTLSDQSGSDFSLNDEGGGRWTIRSARGGMFQCGMYLGDPGTAGLDAGSSRTRYLTIGAVVGSTLIASINNLGLDLTVPLTATETAETCYGGVPGVVEAGGIALDMGAIYLTNGFGTDSVDLATFLFPTPIVVWQIA